MKNLMLCLSPIWVTLCLGVLSPGSNASPPPPKDEFQDRVDDLEVEAERLGDAQRMLIHRQGLFAARVHRLELRAQDSLERETLGPVCHDCGNPLELCDCSLEDYEPNPRCTCGAEER